MAPCTDCGEPCRGRRCDVCQTARDNERVYGTPENPDTPSEEWTIEQTGLDGGAHAGQTTLDGGVAKEVGSDGDE